MVRPLNLRPLNRLWRQQGLTYIESTLAVILLAACIVPALEAVGNRIGQQAMLTRAGRDTHCMKEAMERTAIEPFGNLLSAATSTYSGGTFQQPTVYSLAADSSCPYPRNVYILRYDPVLADPFSSTGDVMLYLRVETPSAGLGTLALRK